ncbi:uncharacterized protein C2845_PM15G11420 [Panicum miliaceum]|uniref:C2H2-type domain-containing protein n=1 Tax=Panicum miliaceum TaxID=4540 RepID=A0A3L6Q936_PANMI|nr:uncharacterized protein C2845_PM15G11420 [Panicum miliaceum]
MNSRAYQFQLQAAEAAAVASPVHAADDDEPEQPSPKILLLELQLAQGTFDAPPAPRQGSGVAPMAVGNAQATKCPECPKWFVSEKAMFGHLRKHPERGYKGATPPGTAVAGDKKPKKQVARKEANVSAMNMTAAAATAGEKNPWGAAELSTKWPVTAKRRRAPSAPSGERALEAGMASSCCEDEQAAMILLEIASSSRSTTAESQTPAVKELANLEITTQAVLILVPAANKSVAPSSGSKKAKKRRTAVQDLEQTAASPAPPEGADGKPAARRIPSPASDKKHECPTCGKSFPTYQALGGHMSSHVKGKTGARHDDLAAAQAMHNILAHRNQSAVNSAAPHVCAECHMTFPSGQALGGHKRKHWFPEKYQAKAAALAEPAAPAPAPAARAFDLNEMPQEGEGESDRP